MKGKQTNKHQANTARYRRFGLDEQTVYSHYQTASRTRRHFPTPMAPDSAEIRRLFTSSPRPRNQEAVLIDEDLRRDMEEQQQQEQQHLDRQQHQGEGTEVQIVGVVLGPNEDQEVRSWKMFTGNVRW